MVKVIFLWPPCAAVHLRVRMGNRVGNLFSECQRISIDQCDICTSYTHVLGQGRTNAATGSRQDGGGRAQPGAAATGTNNTASQQYQPTNMSEAELMQHALRLSRLEAERAGGGTIEGGAAGSSQRPPQPPSEEQLAIQARQREKNAEEARQRARLRDEQEDEYAESLRVDKEREEAKQKKLQEEEEARQKELDAAAEVAAAEDARKAQATSLIEEARGLLTAEPPADTASRVQVALKTPDGKRLKRAFVSTDLIAQLYYYALVEVGETLAETDFRIVTSMPRCVYEDRSLSLEDAGIKGQCALLVEVIDKDD